MKRILAFVLVAALALCLSASALAGRRDDRNTRNIRNPNCPYATDGYCEYDDGDCPSNYCYNGGRYDGNGGGQGRCGGCRRR